MTWAVKYLPSIDEDLSELSKTNIKRVKKVIEERIINGEPDKTGKPLQHDLTGCRRIRTGDLRIVYRVNSDIIEILIIAVGMRRDDEIYNKAKKRVLNEKRNDVS